MKRRVSVKWLNNMAFQGISDSHVVSLDASHEEGGNDNGLRPKALLVRKSTRLNYSHMQKSRIPSSD